MEPVQCWTNGRLAGRAEATVPAFDHGLLYGDGVFEGIRFYHRRPFRLDAHLRRLVDSARALNLTIPYSPAELAAAVHALVAAVGCSDGYLRLLVTRGEGPLGLDPATCARPNVIILADHLKLVGEQSRASGIRAIVASTRRLPADGLDPRIKSLNYLNHVLARMEANQAGVDEAILLNGQGRVAEGTAENLFVGRAGALFTPRPVDGCLSGITRAVVMELAERHGIAMHECPLTPFDLYTADECFLTGTGAELVPVGEIDGRALAPCPGPLFTAMQQAFRALVDEECETAVPNPAGRGDQSAGVGPPERRAK